MNSQIECFLKPMYGKICCRQRVWRPKSLHFGFGEKQYHKDGLKLIDTYYGEWEIGTYYCAWRIFEGNKILCGSDDSESVEELNIIVNKINFGSILSIIQLTRLDVRAEFDSGIMVDFLATISDEDQCFSVIHNGGKMAAQFAVASGWTMGPSNMPWKGAS